MGNLYGLLSPTNLRRLAWLAFLGPFFFLSYNVANDLAAAREPDVPAYVFAWEHYVPLIPWTILPYWSSDILYALTFLTCKTKEEVDLLGKRLLAIQVLSVACFIAFPLRLTYPRPHLEGLFGALFDGLYSFDQLYNEAPSLHVSLAYILSRQYKSRWAKAWFILIVISTMTTHQHHFIDLPTGLWAGVLVVALLPAAARPECRSRKLAAAYGTLTILLTYAAFRYHWILLWPALSFSLVAAAYTTGRAEVLGKRGGFIPPWMWPYTICALINSRLWSKQQREIADGVWQARAPRGKERDRFNSIIDLTAELPLKADIHIPMLDLVPPSAEQLEAAIEAINALSSKRPTLVCCALGYFRSAATLTAWQKTVPKHNLIQP